MQRAAKVGLLVGATGAATYRLQGRASSEHDITKVGARSKSSSSFDVVPREAAAVLRPRFMRLLSEQEYSKLESRRLFLERRIAEDGLSEMAWTVVATVIAVPATILASTAGLKRGKWMIFALIMTAGTFADFIVTQELTAQAQRQIDAVRGVLAKPNHVDQRHRAVRLGILPADVVVEKRNFSVGLLEIARQAAPTSSEQASVEEGVLPPRRASEYRAVAAAAMAEELAPARPFEKLFRTEREALDALQLQSRVRSAALEARARAPMVASGPEPGPIVAPRQASERANEEEETSSNSLSRPSLDSDLQSIADRVRRLSRLQSGTKDAWLKRNVQLEKEEVLAELRAEAAARGQAGALSGDMQARGGQGWLQSMTGAVPRQQARRDGDGDGASIGAASDSLRRNPSDSPSGSAGVGMANTGASDVLSARWLADTAYWMRAQVRSVVGMKGGGHAGHGLRGGVADGGNNDDMRSKEESKENGTSCSTDGGDTGSTRQ